VAVSADVGVQTTATGNVVRGRTYRYSSTITNNGVSDASGVSVSSSGTPAGIAFVSNSGDCTQNYPCALGTLAPGSTRTITTTLCVPSNYAGPAGFAISVQVSATSSDPNSLNDTYIISNALDTEAIFANDFEGCP